MTPIRDRNGVHYGGRHAWVFGVGPEASGHLAVAHQFVDAGYDHLALINAGPGPEGFFDFFASELA